MRSRPASTYRARAHVDTARPRIVRATESWCSISPARVSAAASSLGDDGEVGSLSEEACRLARPPRARRPARRRRCSARRARSRSSGASAASGSSRYASTRCDATTSATSSSVMRRGKVPRSRQMLLAAVALRERVVGDLADQVLQEAVLAVLGRTRIGLQPEQLLAHEPGEHRFELDPARAR